jgi:hypothetical protein
LMNTAQFGHICAPLDKIFKKCFFFQFSDVWRFLTERRRWRRLR